MFKRIFFLTLCSFLLSSCAEARISTPTSTPMPIIPAPTIEERRVKDSNIVVWYLGANGWALQIENKLLIFDYQTETDPNPPRYDEPRNLENGYIDPEQIKDFDVYVFVTHSHFDHFTPKIYTWESEIDQITYIFGWEAGINPDYYYMIEERATTQIGEMEIYTIYSHHSGVAEVAYLVLVDGYTIYHNGDYKAAYEEDYEYLRTITEHIDIAFVIGHPDTNHQYFLQTLLLSDLFQPTRIFAMNLEGEAYRCQEFAELLEEQGVESEILFGEVRGDRYSFTKSVGE